MKVYKKNTDKLLGSNNTNFQLNKLLSDIIFFQSNIRILYGDILDNILVYFISYFYYFYRIIQELIQIYPKIL